MSLRRTLLLMTAMAYGLATGVEQPGTLAFNTSAVSSASNQFATGSVTLDAGLAAGDTLTLSNLVPGDQATAALRIENTGALQLRYALTTQAAGDAAFAGVLRLTVRAKTASPCSAQDGDVVYGPASLAAAAFGNPALGAQSGDRPLDPGASEMLCFTVAFPLNPQPGLEGKQTTAAFTFRAEQTANNP